jgi:beta-hydroxylase
MGERLRATRRRVVKRSGRVALQAIDHFLARQSLIGDHPFFDAERFACVRTLEREWRPIREELDRLLEAREHIPSFHMISPDQGRISRGDRWKTFILFGFGRKAERNCRQCPRTARVLESIPHLQNAWFSILAPGYHIPPHRGVTKGLVRIHLGLLVPRQSERCRIRVDEEVRHWEEGRCLVFDDTFDHEVWNETDEERAVLFIDVERPLGLAGRLVNRSILTAIQWTAYVKDARRNLAEWEARFETAVQRADAFTRPGGDDEPRGEAR